MFGSWFCYLPYWEGSKHWYWWPWGIEKWSFATFESKKQDFPWFDRILALNVRQKWSHFELLSSFLGILMAWQGSDIANTSFLLVKVTEFHFRSHIRPENDQIWLVKILRIWFFEIFRGFQKIPFWVWCWNIDPMMWEPGWKHETAISRPLTHLDWHPKTPHSKRGKNSKNPLF